MWAAESNALVSTICVRAAESNALVSTICVWTAESNALVSTILLRPLTLHLVW